MHVFICRDYSADAMDNSIDLLKISGARVEVSGWTKALSKAKEARSAEGLERRGVGLWGRMHSPRERGGIAPGKFFVLTCKSVCLVHLEG